MSKMAWQQVLDNITRISQLDGLMQQFSALKTDQERVQFCLERRIVHESVSKWLDSNIRDTSNKGKSETVADQYRTKGNNYFIKGHNQIALDLYTKGIIHAPFADTASTLSLLFGNRSAVYFRMKNYQCCVQDIDLALCLGFPQEKRWKLYKRKSEACFVMGNKPAAIQSIDDAIKHLDKFNTNEFDTIVTLKNKIESLDTLYTKKSSQQKLPVPVHGSHSVLKNASQSLDVNFSESKGRFLTTNENLTTGSIILTEKPYAAVLLPSWFESHCQHCFERLSYIIPCFQCTRVRYCSDFCRLESWQQYHYFECGKLHLMESIGIAHLALRIILVTDTSMLKTMYSNEEEVLSSHNQMWPYNSSSEYTCNYKSVFHLMPNSEHMIPEDLFQYTIGGIMLYMVMERCLYFNETVRLKAKESCKPLYDGFLDSSKINNSPAEESYKFVAYLLSRHIQQLVCNAHAITDIHNTETDSTHVISQEQVRIATAIYPTTSLLNHSCEPSITNSFSKGGVLAVKLIKDVSKGDEIFNCYGPDYRRAGFRERQDVLKSQYFFNCDCVHCIQSKEEEERYDAFKCKCGAGVIMSLANCASCNIKVDHNNMQRLDSEADDAFMQGLQILQSNPSALSIKQAISKFEQCLEKRKTLLLGSHKKLCEVKDVISKCYAMLCNYPKSYCYLQECILQIESRYGNESVEVMHELLKMSDVAVQWLKNETERQPDLIVSDLQSKIVYDTLEHIDRSIDLVKFYNENDKDELNSLEEKKLYLLKLKNSIL